MAFTAKQFLFIVEYVRDFNGTRAAIDAGYSEKTAHAIAWENLRKPEIAEEIERIIAHRCMTKDEVLTRLAEQARGDLGQFVVKDGDAIGIDLEAMKEAGQTHLIKKITQTRRRRSYKDTVEEETTVGLELYSAQGALQLIGKHHKLFVDRTEVTGADGAPLVAIDEILEKVYGKSDRNPDPA